MSYYGTIRIDDTPLIKLTPQRRYNGITIGGTWAYTLKGILSLTDDATTQDRANAITLLNTTNPNGTMTIIHPTYGTITVNTGLPYIKHYEGINLAEIDWMMILTDEP